jgi:hypothetical protein
VKREPLYWPQPAAMLDQLELSSDVVLYNRVCAAIDLILDQGDSAAARREQIRTTNGAAAWKVRVRTRAEDWVILWWPVERDAQIYYIGEL